MAEQRVADADENDLIIKTVGRWMKFNWWHFCYSITDAGDEIVAYQFVLEILRYSNEKKYGWNEDKHATTISLNCDKNLQWIQTVGCYNSLCSSLFVTQYGSLFLLDALQLLFLLCCVVSCLLYSLFFMLHLSIWNVGSTYRILNKLWIVNKRKRILSVVRCTNV